MWQWLVNQGHLYSAIVGWTVGALCGLIFGLVLHNSAWKRLRHFAIQHEKTQKIIADRLDTNTPGGLGDLKRALEKRSGGTSKGQE